MTAEFIPSPPSFEPCASCACPGMKAEENDGANETISSMFLLPWNKEVATEGGQSRLSWTCRDQSGGENLWVFFFLKGSFLATF